MYEKIGSCAALLLVGYLSAWDIRTRKLPALPLLLFGALRSLIRFVRPPASQAGRSPADTSEEAAGSNIQKGS